MGFEEQKHGAGREHDAGGPDKVLVDRGNVLLAHYQRCRKRGRVNGGLQVGSEDHSSCLSKCLPTFFLDNC